MRHLVVLIIHLIAILAQLLEPGGVRSLVAESLLLKHQLLIVNRSRQRSPNLSSWDRILAGWMALLVRPTRLLRSAIVLKPSTLLALHKAMSKRKYRMLFTNGLGVPPPNRQRPGSLDSRPSLPAGTAPSRGELGPIYLGYVPRQCTMCAAPHRRLGPGPSIRLRCRCFCSLPDQGTVRRSQNR
jgi:hypothetical protein